MTKSIKQTCIDEYIHTGKPHTLLDFAEYLDTKYELVERKPEGEKKECKNCGTKWHVDIEGCPTCPPHEPMPALFPKIDYNPENCDYNQRAQIICAINALTDFCNALKKNQS